MPELPVQNQGSSIGGPLGVSLDTEGRTNIEIYATCSGAADYVLWGSDDEYAWRKLKDPLMSLDAAGKIHRGMKNAYRWVHVATANPFDNFIEIVASGAP